MHIFTCLARDKMTFTYDLVNNVTVGEPFSDHNAITFTISSAPYTSRISKKYTYAFNRADWSHLKSLFNTLHGILL